MQVMAFPSQSPHWYGVIVRILLLTLLGTLICFCVTLLLAIVGTVASAAVRGIHPDMRIAYHDIAMPLALLEAGVILILASVLEIRHYRHAKALSGIERAS
jgi:uncharacterized BrkB/YihY/UPF0761 family membrane protein